MATTPQRKKFNLTLPSDKSHGTSTKPAPPAVEEAIKNVELPVPGPMGPEGNMPEEDQEKAKSPMGLQHSTEQAENATAETDQDLSHSESAQPSPSAWQIQMIPRDKIIPNKNNFYNKANIEELASLIRDNGLEQNLVVYPGKDGLYHIISGERRYHATELLFTEDGSFADLPCIVELQQPADDDKEVIRIITSNTYRQFTDAEKFETFLKLRTATENLIAKGSMDEITNQKVYYSRQLGMSETQAQRCITIATTLSEELQQKILCGDLSIRQAEDLCKQLAKNASKPKKEKEVSLFVDSNSLGVIPELMEDAKSLFANEYYFREEKDALAAAKLIKQIEKGLQKLNDLMEKELSEAE